MDYLYGATEMSILKSIQVILPSPPSIAYSLYSCENAENIQVCN